LNLDGASVGDLTPLRNLKSLQVLRLTNTPVEDISVLSELPELRVISIDGTRVRDIEPVAGLEYLRSLDVARTRVSDLGPISNLRSLYWIDFAQTAVEDLSPLRNMVDIRDIDLSDTNVADLSPLASLRNIERLDLKNSQIRDLSPVSRFERMFSASYGNLNFKGAPIADPTLLSFAELVPTDRTRKTISHIRYQQGLPQLELTSDEKTNRDSFAPVENVSSLVSFQLSPGGTIALRNDTASFPIFPLRNSERDFEKRLETSRTLAEDLIAELSTARRFQARAEYREGLKRYAERLPRSKSDGNILLADAEARTIRNLFASEVDTIAAPFASKLKTFLEQHIGLRVFYPEITSFYRDVQTGRINEPLSLDAIEGFVEIVRENTPTIFDVSVEEAVDGAAESPPTVPVANNQTIAANTAQSIPPADPLGEVDSGKAHDYTFAGAANSLWKIFLEGERINRGVEAWTKAGIAFRPYVSDILDWLHRFTSSGN
jgi:hypothetical protein